MPKNTASALFPSRLLAIGSALLAAGALLAGCAAPTASPPRSAGPGPAGGRCSAGPAQSVVGKTGTARTVEEARVLAGARMARVLRPGQAMTTEFNAERLNLDTDASGKITAARCG